jgi:hypothetical protein
MSGYSNSQFKILLKVIKDYSPTGLRTVQGTPVVVFYKFIASWIFL